MDITKELQDLSIDKQNINKLMDSVAIEQEELAKKAHLLKVININFLLEYTVLEDYCKNSELKNIQVNLGNEYDDTTRDYETRLIFNLVDSENNIIPANKIPINSQNLQQVLRVIASLSKELRINLYKRELRNDSRYILELKPGIGDKFLDLCLSDELKNIYDYSMMQISLSHNEGNNIKKIKI